MALSAILPWMDVSTSVRLVLAIAGLELLVALGLGVPRWRSAAGATLFLLLAAFAGVALLAWHGGVGLDCGCFGRIPLLGDPRLRWGIVAAMLPGAVLAVRAAGGSPDSGSDVRA